MNDIVKEVMAVEQAAIADLKSAEQKLIDQSEALKAKVQGEDASTEPKSDAVN